MNVRPVLALLACVALPAHAKCVIDTYDVSGHVSGRDGTPISGANVKVTWNAGSPSNSGAKSARSGRDGGFAVAIAFDTLSGESVAGDVCEGKLASATIDVTAPGHTARSSRAAFVGRKAVVDVVLD